MSYMNLPLMYQVGRYLLSSVGLLGAGLYRYANRLTSYVWRGSPSANNGTAARALTSQSPRKPRPTHFVAVQVVNPQIIAKVRELQDHVLSLNENYKKVLVPLSTLHITLMVLVLDGEEERSRARAALSALAQSIRQSARPDLAMTFSGVADFRREVVFAKIDDEDQKRDLDGLAAEVRAAFSESGFPHTDKRDFAAHLTLLKLSRAAPGWLKKHKMKKIDPSIYADFKQAAFGQQAVDRLQLCAMRRDAETDYYQLLHQEPIRKQALETPPAAVGPE